MSNVTFADQIRAQQLMARNSNRLYDLCGIDGAMVRSDDEIESIYGMDVLRNWCKKSISRWNECICAPVVDSDDVREVARRSAELFNEKFGE